MPGPKTRKPGLRRVPMSTRLDARAVSVSGDFSGWSADGIRMTQGADGLWSATLALPPGEYQYRLRVDGEWRDHPEAARRVPNPYGTENDVLTVE